MNRGAPPIAVDTGTFFDFRNDLAVPVEGGHVQGIQQLGDHYVISGSSDRYAYLGLISLRDRVVTELRVLLQRPFKHAGGFQVNGQWMAVGIEDNEARDVSKVYLYQLTDPTSLPQEPITIVERAGAYERATAGAVGIAEADDGLWLVVGDWDSRHLDFYLSDRTSPEPERRFSITATNQDRHDWSDSAWASYQNLNLFVVNERLYLAGTTSLNDQSDVIDLFEVGRRDLPASARLIKIHRYLLPRVGNTAMRWGGGMFLDESGTLQVLATEKHIKKGAGSIFRRQLEGRIDQGTHER